MVCLCLLKINNSCEGKLVMVATQGAERTDQHAILNVVSYADHWGLVSL